jgi:predicted MPP superfamily phosphohydrolase
MSKIGILKIFFIIFDLFLLGTSLLLFIWKEYVKKTHRPLARYLNITIAILFIPILIQGLVYIDARYIEPNWIEVRAVTIRNNKFTADLKKLKIVQLSDLHIAKYGYREDSLVKTLRRLKPDLIFITGDFLSSFAGRKALIDTLVQLRARLGIYAIFGNRDNDTDWLKDTLESIGINVLNNNNAHIGINRRSGLWIVGAGAGPYSEKNLARAYSGVNLADPVILLAHSQRVFDTEYVDNHNTDLALVGDTHGGQLGVPFVYRLASDAKRYKYLAGLFCLRKVPMYVNRGIGMQEANYRFACRPEVTIIKLEH